MRAVTSSATVNMGLLVFADMMKQELSSCVCMTLHVSLSMCDSLYLYMLFMHA